MLFGRARHAILVRSRCTAAHQAPPTGAQAWATVHRLQQMSPTTKGICLRLDAPEPGAPAFAFEPGQWLDVHIPAINEVGGYSIASLPNELPLLDLAVKASAHPPAAWCTRSAKVGDRVAIQVGGKFVLREAEAALFVAGGVGISPLYGMLRAWCLRAGTHARAALLFAARSRAERLFATQLEGLARAHPERLRVSIHTTREPPQPAAVAAGPGIVGGAQGRIGERDLETALRWIGCEANAVLERRAVPWQDTRARQPGTAALATAATAAYVCGPARMTDDVVGTLKRMGVPHVYSEQWW